MVKIYEINSLFHGFYAFFHPVLDSDPDPNPKPRVPDPCGSGSTTLHKTYTHAVYTVTKRILYKTYTSPPGFSVFAALISSLVLNLWIKLWLM
jgi:hypothetical protein